MYVWLEDLCQVLSFVGCRRWVTLMKEKGEEAALGWGSTRPQCKSEGGSAAERSPTRELEESHTG